MHDSHTKCLFFAQMAFRSVASQMAFQSQGRGVFAAPRAGPVACQGGVKTKKKRETVAVFRLSAFKNVKLSYFLGSRKLLGLSWGCLGAVLGFLRLSWGSCGCLGLPWGCLGPSWVCLGAVWGSLEPLLASLEAVVGRLGPSWGCLGLSWSWFGGQKH